MAFSGPLGFQCDYAGDRNASRLCMNGGVCQVNVNPANGDTIEFCVCPPGFTGDFTLGHFPNCGLPDTALPAMFGIFTAVYLFCLMYAAVHVRQFKSELRRLMMLMFGQTVTYWLMFLTIVIESGFYEAAAVFLFFGSVLVTLSQVQMTLMTSLPIYSMFKKSAVKIKRSLYAVILVTSVALLAITACLIAFARDSNPDRFNKVMVIFWFFNCVSIILLASISAISTTSLKRSIERSHANVESRKMDLVIARLDKIIISAWFSVAMFIIILAFPISYSVLKSFPGQYIFFFFIHLNPAAFLAQATSDFKIASEDTLDDVRASKRRSHKLGDAQSSRSSKNILESRAVTNVNESTA